MGEEKPGWSVMGESRICRSEIQEVRKGRDTSLAPEVVASAPG